VFPWEAAGGPEAVAFLRRYPNAIDSLEVLVDLYGALLGVPGSRAPWFVGALSLPLLRRVRAVLADAVERARVEGGGSHGATWLDPADSRNEAVAALGALLDLQRGPAAEPIEELCELLLAVDPGDFQGAGRALLADRLRAGRWADALDLADRLDGLRRDARIELGPAAAEIDYGRALALFALGREPEARAALASALERAPLVADYLAGRKRAPPKPRFGDSAAEAVVDAWEAFLRLDEAWQAVPGVAAWAKSTRARIEGRDRAPRRSVSRAPSRRHAARGICRLRIELDGIEPPIWRRIELRYGATFWELHVAIQDAMGWRDCHLHEFHVEDPRSGEPVRIGAGGPIFDDEAEAVIPGWTAAIAEHLTLERPLLHYEYDFGDSWEHTIVLEALLPEASGQTCPRCLDGARACPPEDCGGISGYQELVEAMRDPAHPEHEAMRDWLGGPWDPERFDPAEVRFEDAEERLLRILGG
jgi:hypothetical protein